MKKICLLGLVLFFCLVGNSQVVLYRSSDVITVGDFRLQAGKNFFLPRYADTTAANLDKGIDSCGALIYIGADVSIYYRSCNPKKWSKLYSGTPSTNYIDTLRRSSDSVYGRKNGVYYFQFKDSVGGGGGSTDTTSLSNRINARVQYIDTSGMLAPYFRRSLSANDTIKTNGKVLEINAKTATKSSIFKIDTTGLIGDVTLGSNTADFVLSPTYTILGQTVGANINVISMQPGGGVECYATNASTTDGFNATANVGFFWYVNNYDTIGVLPRTNGISGQVLKLQDGAQMVWANDSTGSVDTSSLSSRIDARVRYTDTAALLTPYLRKADTASLSSRINTRLLISDTTVFGRKELPAYSFMANGTNVSANSVATYFKDTSGTYSGAITWTGTTAPSGATNHSYRWTRIGKMVTLNIELVYATNGGALTALQIDLPSDCPIPSEPSGLTGASQNMYPVLIWTSSSTNALLSAAQRGFLRNNTANTGYDLLFNFSSHAPNSAYITLTYWTN